MPRSNQITNDDDNLTFICHSCDGRTFSSEHNLIQHCRSKYHAGEWCEDCDWLFISPQALTSHINDSNFHWLCQFCDQDCSTQDELVNHTAKRHHYCWTCQVNFGNHRQHLIESHYMCTHCSQTFASTNNLLMHEKVHLPKQKECYGCRRTFASDSAIMIHLESGACSSGTGHEDLDRWAFECYQHPQYTNGWFDHYQYHCPTCDTNFVYLSGLLQHVESPACSENYKGSIGKLRNYLMKRVETYDSNGSSDDS